MNGGLVLHAQGMAHSKSLRVAHVGNLGGNAFLNAKFQRQYLGWDAHSFDYGRGYAMWAPYWEDADWDVSSIPAMEWVDRWSAVSNRSGWKRPPWARILGNRRADPSFPTQEAFEAQPLPPARYVPLRHFDGCRLSTDEIRELNKDFRQQKRWPAIQELAKDYDVVALYGPEAASAVALPRNKKVVTFECSTMRTVPRLDTPSRRSLAKGYQVADWNLLTNADCVRSARALGLERYSLVPHPVDTKKFQPATSPDAYFSYHQENPHTITVGGHAYIGVDLEAVKVAAQVQALRTTLLARHETELLLFAPARHALDLREGPKANDKILHAFARYVTEDEPKGLPKATLLLLRYGNGLPESDRLIDQLGIGHRVLWMPPLPKRQYVRLLQAADIVLDQFSEDVGSFGTTTIEALACGKPCITFVAPRLHEWCKETLPIPPVVNALSVDDICMRLRALADPQVRWDYGQRGLAWVQEWQSPERVGEVWKTTIEKVI